MDTITTILELAGATAVSVAASSLGYATFLAISGGRQKLNWDRLLSYGVLAPTLWVGMSGVVAIGGLFFDALPNSILAVAYSAAIALVPSAWLAHSVIEDIAGANSVSPSRETSRKSTSAPKKNSSTPPPPRHW